MNPFFVMLKFVSDPTSHSSERACNNVGTESNNSFSFEDGIFANVYCLCTNKTAYLKHSLLIEISALKMAKVDLDL